MAIFSVGLDPLFVPGGVLDPVRGYMNRVLGVVHRGRVGLGFFRGFSGIGSKPTEIFGTSILIDQSEHR